MTPSRPVLRYHGGKWRLAPWIISHFPPHRTYVEPFGGAASVLIRKPRAYSEVYNDMWGSVVDVFRVLRDPDAAARLRTAVELTPYAREEFEACYSAGLETIGCPVERSRRVILRAFAGHGSGAVCGVYATGFRANSKRSYSTPADNWRDWPSQIPAFVDRLRGVTIEQRPAVDVMLAHDGPDVLHYVDPPYIHATRNIKRGKVAVYVHEMDDAAHAQLLEVLRGLSGMVVLSGYDSELYSGALADWHCVEREASADGAVKRTEKLWLNPQTSAALAMRDFW